MRLIPIRTADGGYLHALVDDADYLRFGGYRYSLSGGYAAEMRESLQPYAVD